MDGALRMDANRYPVERHLVEVVRLDYLEALVHQRRRVDRDFRAHRPSRMVQRLLDGDLVQVELGVGPERPAAGGDDKSADVRALLAPKALPDGAVLGVDWPDPH